MKRKKCPEDGELDTYICINCDKEVRDSEKPRGSKIKIFFIARWGICPECFRKANEKETVS